MPQSADGQEPREESPTSQPEQLPVSTQPTQPVDTGAAPADQTPAPETSTAPEGESPKDDRPRDDAGRFAPKDSKPATPDPVKDAIDRLSRKVEPKPDATKQPGKAAAEPPKDAKAPQAPTDEALKSRTKDDLDAPPEERARWKKDTADRFDRVLNTARSARQELEKAAPLIEHGKFYSEVLDKYELKDDIGFVPPEHFAGVVKAQAAVNRALIAINQGRTPAPQDVETFTALAASVDNLRTSLGLKPPATPSAAVAPFAGELPADLKDLVEVYGVDEKRVRLLAAMEAITPPAAAPVAAPQPVQAPAPVQPQQRPVGVDMEQLYGRKLLSELQSEGVQNPSERMLELLEHQQTRQEIIRRFPGTTLQDVPVVFNSLDAVTKYEVLRAAQRALTVKPVPARSTTLPPPTRRTVQTSATPRGMATAAGQDAVAAAISLLARE